jgi:hypothetical protein
MGKTKIEFYHFPVEYLRSAMIHESLEITLEDALAYTLYALTDSFDLPSDMESALSYMGVSAPDPTFTYRKGERLHKANKCTVMVNVSREMYWQYRKEEKDQFEIACFCAFLGVRSIIGKKPYVKINNDFFVARMFGFSSHKDIPAEFKETVVFKKFTTRRLLDKIKNELQATWHLKYYGQHTRGFYVSIALDIENLVYQVEKNRKSFKEAISKKEKQNVIAKVKALLNAQLINDS